MKLISPIGIRISVDDYRGEKLLKQGYRRPEAAAAPAPEKPRRTRRKKTEEATEEA